MVGVADGFGEVHRCANVGHSRIERFGVEHVAEVIDRGSNASGLAGEGVVGGGAVDGGGDLWLVDPVEEHGQAGERRRQVDGVPAWWNESMAGGEQVQGLVEVAVNGFEPGGFAGDERLKVWESGALGCRRVLSRKVSRARAGSVSANARP